MWNLGRGAFEELVDQLGLEQHAIKEILGLGARANPYPNKFVGAGPDPFQGRTLFKGLHRAGYKVVIKKIKSYRVKPITA